jgi:hypothetical protein
MPDAMALRVAVDLMHVPSRVRIARSQPLPEGVHMLLCIAAGEEAAESAAVASTGRTRDVVQRAAGFFIEQVLLCPSADSYRVLGATCEATNAELRRNMALLMRWLHPDMDPVGRRSMFASRVTRAWNDLKTAELRAIYDRETRLLPAKTSRESKRRLGGKRPRASSFMDRLSTATSKPSLLRRLVGGWVHWRSLVRGENMFASQSRRPRLFRAILFAVLATVLVWEVTSRTLARHLASVVPEQALAIRALQPTALLNLAEEKIGIGVESINRPTDARAEPLNSEDQKIRTTVESALLNDPLNARALRLLGQLANKSHDETRALQFMQTAARYSMNEYVAVAWLADKSFEKKDYGAALHYVDVLLRKSPGLINYVMPTLVQIAEDKEASGGLRSLLSDNPPWRALFFAVLPNRISDARTPFELLVGLKDSPNPPSVNDLRGYLDFLIAHRFYSLAYYAWLQFLPPEQLTSVGLLFNGSFETVPSGLPFDWVITPGTGVTIDMVAAPDHEGGRALEVAFAQGRVDFRGVTQLIALPPGKYRFEGKYTGEITGTRGMKWRVTCVDATTIGESGMVAGRTPTWKNIDFSFTVPGANCPAQSLHLDLDARMSSEQFVSGTVWFGDLRLVSLADAANK